MWFRHGNHSYLRLLEDQPEISKIMYRYWNNASLWYFSKSRKSSYLIDLAKYAQKNLQLTRTKHNSQKSNLMIVFQIPLNNLLIIRSNECGAFRPRPDRTLPPHLPLRCSVLLLRKPKATNFQHYCSSSRHNLHDWKHVNFIKAKIESHRKRDEACQLRCVLISYIYQRKVMVNVYHT